MTGPDLTLQGISPDLAAMLDQARHHAVTPDEIEAQRRSWVIGEAMLRDENLTREQAERLYDQASRGSAAP